MLDRLTNPLNDKIKFAILLGSLSIVLLSIGLSTKLFLGDEIFHYHFAKMVYELKQLPTHDPLFGAPNDPGNYFIGVEPLWHLLLSAVWKLTGGISLVLAQIYHLGYYMLLLLAVFLIGQRIGGSKAGLYSALLVGTTPMVVVFSILFYLDVPSISFLAICVYLILSKRFAMAGLFLGLTYLTKRNAVFLLPSLLFLIIYQVGLLQRSIWLRKMFIFLGAGLLVALPDLIRRGYQLGSLYQVPPVEYERVYADIPMLQYNPSSALNPLDLITYFGVASFLMGCLFFSKKKKETEGFLFLIPIVNYLFVFLIFFGYIMKGGFDVRYLMPVVPFLCVMGGLGFSDLSRKGFRLGVILLCILQFVGSGWKIYQHRKPTPETLETFRFIKEHTPEEASILYPEDNLLYWAERKPVWGRFRFLPYLFWKATPEEAKDIFRINKIGYVLVKNSRIYDDSEVKHRGGYPKSFIEKLHQFRFVKVVFENSEMSLWEIERKERG